MTWPFWSSSPQEKPPADGSSRTESADVPAGAGAGADEPVARTSIEATTKAPPRTTDEPSRSPAAQANNAANTGSRENTRDAPVADMYACAHDWTAKANAVAATAVITNACHSPLEAGTCTPEGSWTAVQRTATTISCTVASP